MKQLYEPCNSLTFLYSLLFTTSIPYTATYTLPSTFHSPILFSQFFPPSLQAQGSSSSHPCPVRGEKNPVYVNSMEGCFSVSRSLILTFQASHISTL